MYQVSLVTDLSLVRLFRDPGRKSQKLESQRAQRCADVGLYYPPGPCCITH